MTQGMFSASNLVIGGWLGRSQRKRSQILLSGARPAKDFHGENKPSTRCSVRGVSSEPFPGLIEQILLFPRENQCELEASGSGSVPGSVPVHTLPSTYLQKVPEQPEDADNQKNVTRMIQPPLDKTTTVNIPVTITAPPGDTTVIPSECLCPLLFLLRNCLEIQIPKEGGMGALLGAAILERGTQGTR